MLVHEQQRVGGDALKRDAARAARREPRRVEEEHRTARAVDARRALDGAECFDGRERVFAPGGGRGGVEADILAVTRAGQALEHRIGGLVQI